MLAGVSHCTRNGCRDLNKVGKALITSSVAPGGDRHTQKQPECAENYFLPPTAQQGDSRAGELWGPRPCTTSGKQLLLGRVPLRGTTLRADQNQNRPLSKERKSPSHCQQNNQPESQGFNSGRPGSFQPGLCAGHQPPERRLRPGQALYFLCLGTKPSGGGPRPPRGAWELRKAGTFAD